MKYFLAGLIGATTWIASPCTVTAAASASPLATEEGPTGRQVRIARMIQPIVDEHASRPKDLTAYLLVYFGDETHSLYFAVSTDGYRFTDVNNGAPVLAGRDIAEQRGIRDPHIFRGPDNAFYMAMTDLHIHAQKEGFRATKWERPAETYGWGNNRSLVLMKSWDLINWTHSIVHVAGLYGQNADIGAAWAPQTIYDPQKRKMMVYYSTRTRNGSNRLVYSYANDAFTKLMERPQPLFSYPKPGIGTVDGDITQVGDKYRLFYSMDDRPGHLRQAVSARINGGYAFDPRKIDPEIVATEAPNLWRRHGTDIYVLMYDVVGAKPRANMGFSETRDFVHFRDIGHFNDPGSPMKTTNFSGPRHGAVMPISLGEVDRLKHYFAIGSPTQGIASDHEN